MRLTITVLNWFRSPALSEGLQDWKRRGTYFSFSGNDIFYIDEKGQKDGGSPLVLIHGYPTHSYDWHKMLPALKTKFNRVIAPDLFGYGFSAKPRRYYKISEQAELIEALLKTLDVATFHVLAHDYGDTVGQELLARECERQKENNKELEMKTLCFTNGGIFPETHKPFRIQRKGSQKYTGIFYTFPAIYSGALFSKIGAVFGPNTQPTKEEQHDMWCSVRYNKGERMQQGLLTYMEQRRQNRERWVGSLQTTKVPLHIIHGEADPINPPPFEDHYRKLLPHSGMTILKNIGHWPNMEAPEEVLEAYFNFMKDQND